MIALDLPSLQSIELGENAFKGKDNDESCSLIMRSKNEIMIIEEYRSSKSNIHDLFVKRMFPTTSLCDIRK